MRAEQSPVALAIDIGGTFTDLAAVDARTGELLLAKADSTPTRLQQGVLSALERSGLEPRDVGAFVHGSTVVINAITERRGARTAVVTTEGFRDVLEIGRANRPDLYNLSYRKPEPFVPRRFRFEVRERISHRGEVLFPLDKVGVERIADHLRADIDAVAICFLHSWINPDHERRTAELLSKLLKGVEIVASHEVSTQWREYERISTTVLSAYVKPTVADYLYDLRSGLRDAGIASPLYAMRSSGGVSSFERAVTAPITLLESGPVAGVTAAAELGRRLGTADVLTLDIGGTTAKTSAVRGGWVRIETLHHVERTPTTAGYPVQAPIVEIVEIGAGGGSIASLDDAGGLHVGPRSAGADPGPACYGRGGVEATVTDASVVLGYLNPDYFAGGSFALRPELAEAAVARVANRIAASPLEAAWGIHTIVNANMTDQIRLISIGR